MDKKVTLEMMQSEVPFDAIELMEWAIDNGWSTERLVDACQEVAIIEYGIEKFFRRIREYGLPTDVVSRIESED